MWNPSDRALTGNRLQDIPQNLPQGALDALYLDGNNISVVDLNAFGAAVQLRVIDLALNDITYVADFAFATLVGDVHGGKLNISHNRLSNLTAHMFAGLGTIDTLDLSNNHVSFIDPNVFDGLKGLVVLSLAYNNLSSLSGSVLSATHNSFNGYRKLNTLDFANNDITQLTSDLLAGTPLLTSLYVAKPFWVFVK